MVLTLDADPVEAAVVLMRAEPNRNYARADLLGEVDGLAESNWPTVARRLAEYPEVDRTGARRGTRYQWAGVQ